MRMRIGVPGAFMTLLGITALQNLIKEYVTEPPHVILQKLDDQIHSLLNQNQPDSISQEGMDLILAFFDLEHHRLDYSTAMRPFWIVRDNKLIELERNPKPVGGIWYTDKPFLSHSIDLQPNDMLYLFSDGIIDQIGGKEGNKLGTRKFSDFLLSIHSHTLPQQNFEIKVFFDQWKAEWEQLDDVVVVGIRY